MTSSGFVLNMRTPGVALVALLALLAPNVTAQIDPIPRNQVQLGYDQPLSGSGPQALYAYYYLNVPEFTRTNVALRLAVAPVYLSGELGFRGVISPYTDLGIGIYGGGFGDNYYEVRGGRYYRGQSFWGHGGGGALNLYQALNPGQTIPLNVVVSGGYRYATYDENSATDVGFEVPENQNNLFTRAGLRVAGKEPRLYPDLGMELSVWFERQWRLEDGDYGVNNDRSISSVANLYWLYGELNYAWTNVGHRVGFAFMLGGSDNADRFSAWRLGGVLPLISEFPLILPGYYYQEISAERFAHWSAAYAISLDSRNSWQLRFEGAVARVDYLPGFEQAGTWHQGAGVGLVYTFPNRVFKIAVRYGYGFNAIRDNSNDGHTSRGAHSVGLLLECDFRAWKQYLHRHD